MFELLTHRPGLRFRHAFRTASSVVIAYYLALACGWQSPHWAALTIGTVSALHDPSESLAKGRNRILGTLLGAAFSLLLIGLFYQDRWPFMLSMALWVAFCAYRMGGTPDSYFWQVAGFVAPIISVTSGIAQDAATPFLTAVERTQETLMGICVYMLVSLFVWPEAPEKPDTANPAGTGATGFFPDPDRLVGSVYVFSGIVFATLLVIYVPAFPNGGFVLSLLPSILLVVASSPFIPLRIVYRPVSTALVIATASVLLLPYLSSFFQLALLLFGVSFSISYRYFGPSLMINRAVGLPVFFVMLHISNEQQHNFLTTLNIAAMLWAALLILLMLDHFPKSRMPEKRLAWQLGRFERSARFLAGAGGKPKGPLENYRRAFHRYEVASLPGKLAFWRQQTPPAILAGDADKLDQLLASVHDISERLLREEDIGDALGRLSIRCAGLRHGVLARPRFF